MSDLADAVTADYLWSQPLAERTGWLSRDGFRVAYLYERPDYSTFRYRVFNMVNTLNSLSTDISAAWFFLDEWEEVTSSIPVLDALVICRCPFNYRLDAIINLARARGVDVIFDIDDLIFDPELIPLIGHTLSNPSDDGTWNFWYGHVGRLRATMQACDRVLVTTPTLAAHVTSSLGMEVNVVPNFLNPVQLDVSRDIFEAKVEADFATDGPVNVGYFSGTPSHTKDFEIVAEALEHVLEREPRVRVRIAGFLDTADMLSRRYKGRVDRQAFRHFSSLQELIGTTQINLVPLQSNVFSESKSELKYFEAAIVGTVSIVTPTATYRDVITDGTNGLLADAYEWEEKIMALVSDLLTSRQRYAAMALEAERHAMAHYAPDRVAPLIEQTLLGSRRGTDAQDVAPDA